MMAATCSSIRYWLRVFRSDQRRNARGIAGLVRASTLHENGAAVAAAAGIDDGGDMLVHQVLVEGLQIGPAKERPRDRRACKGLHPARKRCRRRRCGWDR